MAIDNQYDGEVVDGATKFQKREIAVSTRSSPTDKSKAHLEAVYLDTHRQGYNEVQPTSQKPTWKQSAETRTNKSTKKSYQQVKSTPRGKSTKSTKILLMPPIESNHEVDQMVTEADFQRQLPSQFHLPMTTRCTIYSPKHAEALHRAQTALARLNLVGMTVYRNLRVRCRRMRPDCTQCN
jgi:hypothetical protein